MAISLILALISIAAIVSAGAWIYQKGVRDNQARQRWWSSLDKPWPAIFKAAIGINREPTADELVAILSLTELDCHAQALTHLEPLQALTGLQTLYCYQNHLTSLEPLRACAGLQILVGGGNHLTDLEPLRACTNL